MKYDTVVGLEVHIQMNTSTKAFCSDENTFGAEPNTHVSAISAAHPGTLPVANKYHVEKAIKLGLALGCEINKTHYFDRKHYFYPDLPKGYQITQDNQPVCIGGSLNIKVGNDQKQVRIHHIHMEEDAGKTIHDINEKYSLLDLNRAGTPLLELVTEPDLSSAEEVYEFIAELQKLLRYIDVSDADMEKGSMRCDCNVSVKLAGVETLGERCEIKNLNSKKFAREAVLYEAQRQIEMVEAGKSFTKQTLHYDPQLKQTQMMREKEGVADYRYFPDPDLPPITIKEEQLSRIKSQMPELPWEIKDRLIRVDLLSEDYATQIAQSPDIHEFYVALCKDGLKKKPCANLMINQILPSLEEDMSILNFKLSIEQCKAYLKLIESGKVSASVAHQKLWPAMLDSPNDTPNEMAKNKGLIIEQNAGQLDTLIQEILDANPNQLEQYRKGKKALLGFFVGAAMRQSKGSFDPKKLKKQLQEALERE